MQVRCAVKVNSRAFGFLVCLLSLATAFAFAQNPVQTHATGTPASTMTRPDSIQDSGFYGYWANMSAQGRAGGVLLGKLALEGEPLPWEPLQVSVDCKGSIVNTTQADLKGQFVIRFVDTHGVERTPADDQRQMETKYEGCTVRGVLDGFHSSAVTITIQNLRDEPKLATITLSPEGRGGGSERSTTSQAAPSNAIKAFEKARAEYLDGDAGDAEHSLGKAIELYPGFAEAWLQLGKLEKTKDPQAARDSFSKAVAADPRFVVPYEQLAALDVQGKKWKETADDTNQALQVVPTGTPLLWYYDALAKYQLGKLDEAQVSVSKSLAIDPRRANAEQLLAVILSRKADYAGALLHLRNCLTHLPAGPQADLVKQQIAQLEPKVRASK
jgi:tetratricopeptide (TPR) repeat protein